ncbi:putative acetyltransferase [Variibacter gotjawalensis]|uniref:Putative acetyltransferase n=1 Tax=Variibacter gotjawalensis TaxID=1333996 RepID=A0A0S3PUZ0_9BRAD|nr:GNAT family N-acetyltransferase [Variibacter gotjawalensis]NIK50077.1 putative N-acetyltransferase YhbS [Variibacter gotjawalensis]RZS46076.1 putative N-acetyltransferase YhbS [Variibacter gotjawalensis]BAT59751.1 putative acetyltransferase [Variibacter gotjawalensis]
MQVSRCDDPARLPDILAVMHAAFGSLNIDPPSGALRETVDDLAKRLASDVIFIVEEEGALIASVFCTPLGDALYVGRLAVAPSHQRRGIAKRLMAEAESEARRRSLGKLTLRARLMLPDNIAFFRACGFVTGAEHAHAGYAHPTNVEMEKTLSD